MTVLYNILSYQMVEYGSTINYGQMVVYDSTIHYSQLPDGSV